MSDTLKAYFADYAAFHRTPGNKACHSVGIPLIVLSLFSLLSLARFSELGAISFTAAEAVLLAAVVYYATLDWTLALFMLPAALLLDAVGRLLSWEAAIGVFLLGWVLQFVGHYRYEKQSPAFYRNLVHLLVGPLWILARALGRA